ncbi:hypothetical protein [Paractinoplanes brasiliensis]|uniref:hypothetical protein n=1 Tax=Paractinoplanes brasiliensis TaxID=52695 RepID=UPI0010609EC0|nr:hypothetical protein [Actinoplanes brasiliensis]
MVTLLEAAHEDGNQRRVLLGVHPSARTCLEQFPTIGQVRLRLQRVQRERRILNTSVDDNIKAMLNHILLVAEEYRDNNRLSLRDAAREEAALDKVRAGVAEDLELSELDPGQFPRLMPSSTTSPVRRATSSGRTARPRDSCSSGCSTRRRAG